MADPAKGGKAIFLNMHKNNSIKSFVFLSRTGCLLPLLIFLNLFFGWLIFKPRYWLIIEAILILLFIINGFIITRKIISVSSKRDDVIDVKGEVVEDRH
jgi:hypothetical protein